MTLESFKVSGKNALVTGSSRGLGAAIALALAEAGANVGLHGRSAGAEAGCEKIRHFGRKSFYQAGDVSDPGVCSTLITKTIDEFGSIDILINNAGIIRRAPAAEYPQAHWDELIATNLSAVFRLSQLAGQQMLERKQGGKIVNIASLLSFQGGILVPAYAAAKGGVAQLTKALANEWAHSELTSTPSRRDIWPRTIPRLCAMILSAAGKSWSVFLREDGACRRTWPELHFSFLRLLPTIFTATCSLWTAAGWRGEACEVPV